MTVFLYAQLEALLVPCWPMFTHGMSDSNHSNLKTLIIELHDSSIIGLKPSASTEVHLQLLDGHLAGASNKSSTSSTDDLQTLPLGRDFDPPGPS